MAETKDFLIEIGTEELPPRSLKTLAAAFCTQIEKRLQDAKLQYSALSSFATPRRLAVLATDLFTEPPDQSIERRGPAVSAAFDANGKPTGAALGFAKSCGVTLEELVRVTTDKGSWLSYSARAKGRPARELLPAIIEQSLAALPIPKRMRWGAHTEEFVRPVHWIVMLLGTELIETTILGVTTGRQTRGHRFHCAEPLRLDTPSTYAEVLATRGRVIADFATRRSLVRELAMKTAEANGGRAVIDADLLDEVTALVEWPVPVCGSFDAHFLELPREALVASMQAHQKYFPLEDHNGRLLNKFITMSNLESKQPEFVRDGNERVIRPRLTDAAFFWHKDRQTTLAARVPKLGEIVFERRLGSLLDKTERVAKLAAVIAASLQANEEHAARAALLSRCDLISEMVGEFPELQGLMGGYYARHDGEHAAVATAIGEFYMPRYAGDAIPETATGRCVALAEKLDTLVGIFGIGALPTGDKDPYALRRAAIGCLRICIEGGSELDLMQTLNHALAGYHGLFKDVAVDTQVFDFIMERSRAYYADNGVRADIVEAVLATAPTRPLDMHRRIKAVQLFVELPEAAALTSANKRISNILKKAELQVSGEVSTELLIEPAEQKLADYIESLNSTVGIQRMLENSDYQIYLRELATLQAPVNAFFDAVMVMAEDPKLRDNRLRLLHRIRDMFRRVADISLISV